MQQNNNGMCPVCHQPLSLSEVAVCYGCGVPHHRKCWYDNHGCTTFGCNGQIPDTADSGSSYTINLEKSSQASEPPAASFQDTVQIPRQSPPVQQEPQSWNNQQNPYSQNAVNGQIPVYSSEAAASAFKDNKSFVAVIIVLACLLVGAAGFILYQAGFFCKHHWVASNCESIAVCEYCSKSSGRTAGHSWAEATCEKEKTCTVCGMRQGDTIPHKWLEATCEKPKTCSMCGKTEGEANGHSYDSLSCDKVSKCKVCGAETDGAGHRYSEATCDKPKTCEVCGQPDGAPLGHDWKNATCQAPKTCKRCGTTEGSVSDHNWAAATVSAPKTCTVCGRTEGSALTPTYIGKGYVNANGGLNLRSSPSTSASIITTIPNGSSLSVYSGTSGWYYVYYGGSYGYVSSDYVSFSGGGYRGVYGGNYKYVSTNGGTLNLRAGKGTGYSVLAEIPNGTCLYVFPAGDNWYSTYYGGEYGYVSGDWLS